MEIDHIAQIGTFSNALLIIESLVNKPTDSVQFEIITEKLSILKDKMIETQSNLTSLLQAVDVAKQWVNRGKDLSEELEFNLKWLEYIETNLPDQFLPLAKTESEDKVESEDGISEWSDISVITTGSSVNESESKPAAVTNKPVKKVEKENDLPRVQHMTDPELEQVPKYLRGRIQLEFINSFIDTFNEVLTKKYALLRIPKNKVPKGDLPLYLKWKTQVNKETKGYNFITASDLSTFGPKLSKRDYTILQILRHCKRFRENKLNSETFFLLI